MTQNVQISKRLDDGTILVLGGNTWPEFSQTVAEALDGEAAEAILQSFAALTPIGQAVQAAAPLLPQAPVAPVQPYAQNPAYPAAPAPQAPAPESQNGVPVCHHGTKQWRTGTAASTGKTWQAWMCPSPKGTPDQCPADWR